MEDIDEIKKKKLNEMLEKIKKSKESAEFPGSPVTLNDENFDEFVKKYPVVVVDCWAEWCMPCRMVAPVIEELATELKGKVVFGKLNVDENIGVPSRYYISAIPTMLIFKNGEMADRIVGALPKELLKRKILQFV